MYRILEKQPMESTLSIPEWWRSKINFAWTTAPQGDGGRMAFSDQEPGKVVRHDCMQDSTVVHTHTGRNSTTCGTPPGLQSKHRELEAVVEVDELLPSVISSVIYSNTRFQVDYV
jgi:hypothetical protein